MNKIECCFTNRMNGCDDLFRELGKQENITVETFHCIGNCTVCAKKYHCIVNGVRCVAETETELRQLIYKNLRG